QITCRKARCNSISASLRQGCPTRRYSPTTTVFEKSMIGEGIVILIIVNIGTSILHYVDNIIFFSTYPEPPWINTHIIDYFWFAMTPFAVFGYWLFNKGLQNYAYPCLYLYALMNLLVLGHYRYGSIEELSLKINSLIIIEASTAVALIIYIFWLQFRAEKSFAS
ncbi:MAG: hypothetical protein WA040_23830, partial [Anaerolineae bacterium]